MNSDQITINCIVFFFSFISNSLHNEYQVDVILTDFSKTFDAVNHGLLIRELEFLGIGKPLLY